MEAPKGHRSREQSIEKPSEQSIEKPSEQTKGLHCPLSIVPVLGISHTEIKSMYSIQMEVYKDQGKETTSWNCSVPGRRTIGEVKGLPTIPGQAKEDFK